LKRICSIVAGSRMYGIDTPESDTDIRGVFLNTDPGEILGLSRREVIKESDADSLFIEFRHYLGHLRKTNTSAIELLFTEGFDLITDEFKTVREHRYKLIDSDRLYHSLIGYIHNERRLANGERTGELGGKRKLMVDRFGFSPKNFSHLLRLAYCGEKFFRESVYPVSLKGQSFHELVFSVKTRPENYNREQLNLIADEALSRLTEAYESRSDSFKFDIGLANSLCLRFYTPFLKEHQ